RKWDVGTILGRAHGLAIRTPSGWELTTEGRSHVSSLVGTPASEVSARNEKTKPMSQPDTTGFADFLIVTALPEELESAKESFASKEEWLLLARDGESYDAWSSTLETKNAGVINVVATRASSMGMTAAAI